MFSFLKRKNSKKEKTILIFPGRDQDPEEIMSLYRGNKRIEESFNLIAVSPETEWYPKPNGLPNQSEAVSGICKSVKNVNEFVNRLSSDENVDPLKTILSGYSAGGVMALEVSMSNRFMAAVCHSGCILDVSRVKKNQHRTPCLMIHARDDNTFGYGERFMPTKNALLREGHVITTIEKQDGGHSIAAVDVEYAASFLCGL